MWGILYKKIGKFAKLKIKLDLFNHTFFFKLKIHNFISNFRVIYIILQVGYVFCFVLLLITQFMTLQPLCFLSLTWLPDGTDGGVIPWIYELSAAVWHSSHVAACVGSLTVTMLPEALTVLLTLFSLTESKQKDFYTFKVVNSRGKLVSLEKYRGSVSLGPNSWILQPVSVICFTLTSLSACQPVACVNVACLFLTSPTEHFLCRCNNIVLLRIVACSGCTIALPTLAYVARGLQSSCRAP